LHRAVSDVVVHPDEVDLAQRVQRARYRRRSRLTVLALAVVVSGLAAFGVVVTRPERTEPIAGRPTASTNEVPTSAAAVPATAAPTTGTVKPEPKGQGESRGRSL
jgi:hypothetical protein